MNRKISLGLALSLIIITAAASFAVTMIYSQKVYNKIIPRLSARIEMLDELNEIEGYISTKYFAIGAIDEKALNASVADGYLKGLSVGENRYLTAEMHRNYVNKMEGNNRGIGVITAQKPGTAALYVIFVAPGSPAAKEGIVSGDEIVKIDNEDIPVNSYETAAAKLHGISLKSVELLCRRDGKDFTANVLFGFEEQSVAYSVNDTAGYIKITGFYKTTKAQLENAIKELTKQGVTGIVFDVRGTNEGTIEYAAQAVDVLVPLTTEKDAALAKAFNRDNTEFKTFSSDVKELTLPMSVLIDKNTSGGAELFAISLVDFKDAKTVGEKTPGNDKMQELCPLESGAAILLTVARIEAYKTKSYAGGITPTVPIELTAEESAALDILIIDGNPLFLEAAKFPGG